MNECDTCRLQQDKDCLDFYKSHMTNMTHLKGPGFCGPSALEFPGEGPVAFYLLWSALDSFSANAAQLSYLVQDIYMVVFCAEGGVVVTQPVHHGAAGDDDGGKQGADAVLEGWKLSIKGMHLIKASFKNKHMHVFVCQLSASSSPPDPLLEMPHTAPGLSAGIQRPSSGRGPLRSRWLSPSTSSGPQTHSCPASLWSPSYSALIIAGERQREREKED